jgi:hypothetical protein
MKIFEKINRFKIFRKKRSETKIFSFLISILRVLIFNDFFRSAMNNLFIVLMIQQNC